MNPKSSWVWRKHFLPRGFTLPELMMETQKFVSRQYEYEILRNYYIGRQDILNRAMDDSSKPNNKVVNNFAKLIVDTNASYFMGKPVTYVGSDPDTIKKFSVVLSSNDSRDVDAELAKMTSMYGHAFEFHWINKNGEHKFKYKSPRDVFAIYSLDLDEDLLAVVNITESEQIDYKSNVRKFMMEVYDKNTITTLNFQYEGDDSSYDIVESKPHPFGEVPVIEFIANDERQGDFESVMSQIDAYDQVVSDSINDIEYFNDSYLLLRNLNATTIEDVTQMKQNRVLMVDGDGDAAFIEKHIHDSHIENIKNRLVMDIHKHAQTPNLSDEQFATNLSGTAIHWKTQSLEQRTAMRERKFTTSILKRLRLIFNTLGLKGEQLVNDIMPVFVRNIPANLTELADMAIKLKGIVSDETLRSQLPFIIDIEKEEELMNEQKLEDLEMMMFPTTAIMPKDIEALPENNLKGWKPPAPAAPMDMASLAKTGKSMSNLQKSVSKGTVE